MQLYSNLLLAYFILTETDLVQNPFFIGVTVVYFLLLGLLKVLRATIKAIEEKKLNNADNDYLTSLVKDGEPNFVKEIAVKQELPTKKNEIVRELSANEKRQQDEYMKALKSKLK